MIYIPHVLRDDFHLNNMHSFDVYVFTYRVVAAPFTCFHSTALIKYTENNIIGFIISRDYERSVGLERSRCTLLVIVGLLRQEATGVRHFF